MNLFCGENNMIADMPLEGKRIVSLRAMHQSKELSEGLNALGAHVVHFPLLEFIPNQTVLDKLSSLFLKKFNVLIFTSANGVHFFMQDLQKKGIASAVLSFLRIYVVGPKTKEACAQYGLTVSDMPTTYTSKSVLEVIECPFENLKILIISVVGGRVELANKLLELGADVEVLPVYINKEPEAMNAKLEDGDYIVFTSPSTVHRFFNHPCYQNQSIVCFCIGPTTAHAIQFYQSESVIVAKCAMVKSLIDAIKHYAIISK